MTHCEGEISIEEKRVRRDAHDILCTPSIIYAYCYKQDDEEAELRFIDPKTQEVTGKVVMEDYFLTFCKLGAQCFIIG